MSGLKYTIVSQTVSNYITRSTRPPDFSHTCCKTQEGLSMSLGRVTYNLGGGGGGGGRGGEGLLMWILNGISRRVSHLTASSTELLVCPERAS